MSVYQLHPNINELHPILKERQGKWIHINDIPNYPHERDQRNANKSNKEEENMSKEKEITYYLSFGSLQTKPISDGLFPKKISFLSPQETGLTSGNWLGWGSLEHSDHPIDQRSDDGNSLCFDSLPLTDHCGI
jgi:hypothetical protein